MAVWAISCVNLAQIDSQGSLGENNTPWLLICDPRMKSQKIPLVVIHFVMREFCNGGDKEEEKVGEFQKDILYGLENCWKK